MIAGIPIAQAATQLTVRSSPSSCWEKIGQHATIDGGPDNVNSNSCGDGDAQAQRTPEELDLPEGPR